MHFGTSKNRAKRKKRLEKSEYNRGNTCIGFAVCQEGKRDPSDKSRVLISNRGGSNSGGQVGPLLERKSPLSLN